MCIRDSNCSKEILTPDTNAVKLQDQIRKESVKDAFIIIFKDGKKLSFSEAKQYLK